MDNGSSLVEATLATAHEQALAFLRNLNDKPVGATADLATLRERLDRPLTTEGVTPQQVIADLVKDVDGGLLRSAGGRFFGWVIGGSLASAAAADWLTTVWDQNAALFATSPAAAVVEEIAGKWLKEILQLPMHTSFALVTGCQMAHVTCLAAARHSLIERCCEHAHSLVTGIGRLPGAQMLWEPSINQGLIRFLHPNSNASDEDHDRWTDEVIAEIVATGEAFFGGTTWRGQRAMRVSVCNWRTSKEDVERSITSLADVLKRKREQEA